MTTPLIQFQDITTYAGPHRLHHHLNLDIHAHEIIGLIGKSGSGKTSLIERFLGLKPLSLGAIHAFGESMTPETKPSPRFYQQLGVMFQGGALFSDLTLEDNVALPLQLHTSLSPQRRQRLAHFKLSLVGLDSEHYRTYPSQLSGGMVKRAAIARALALDPACLILDEPTAGLDPASASAFDTLIAQLHQQLNLTILMVTHDLDTLHTLTTRTAFLGEERILACEPIDTLQHHTHPLIQTYFHNARSLRFQAEGDT